MRPVLRPRPARLVRDALLVVSVAAGALALLPAVTASAAPAATTVHLLPGDRQQVRPGQTVTVQWTVTVDTGSLDPAVFTTAQDPSLPALGDLEVDDIPVDSVTLGGGNLRADLAPLYAGTHTVSYLAHLSSPAPATTSSTASLSWTDDQNGTGQTASSGPVVVSTLRPDLFVNTAGKTRVYALSHGVAPVAAHVVLHNRAPVDTLFTVTVTRGFRVTAGPRFASGTPAPCVRGPMHATCRITAVQIAQGAKTLITPVAGPSGSTGRAYLSVVAADGEPDAAPADNAANVPVTVVPTADLQLHWSAGTTTINPGGTVSYRIAIHNHGPDAARVVFGAGVAWTDRKYRVSFAGPGLRRFPDHSADFYLGVLRPGANTAVTVTVTAQTPGSYGYVLVAYNENAYDPTYCIDSRCEIAGYREIDVRGGAAAARPHTVEPALNPRMRREYAR